MISFASEFDHLGPLPREGLTSIEAERFLRAAIPGVAHWSCWVPGNGDVNEIVPDGLAEQGQFGAWRWHRQSVPYPRIWYIIADEARDERQTCWTGLLSISGPEHAEFLLFSFLDSTGSVGKRFFVSTTDTGVLDRFLNDVCQHRRAQRRAKRLFLDVVNGYDVEVPLSDGEPICLPASFQEDIERQVMTFFLSRIAYDRMQVPYRRGLLFAGPPGCGKTMMVRRLIRETWREFGLRYWSLEIRASTDDDDVVKLFLRAHRAAPGMIVLEDLDGLTGNPRVSRSTLLAQMDGLAPRQGILVLATTNSPEEIDPALAHRPSRFDRVWRFDLPDETMRLKYLESLMPDMTGESLRHLAGITSGWSYAYLKELRTSAAILAMQSERVAIHRADLVKAADLLSAQFESGRKKHVAPAAAGEMGFNMMRQALPLRSSQVSS